MPESDTKSTAGQARRQWLAGPSATSKIQEPNFRPNFEPSKYVVFTGYYQNQPETARNNRPQDEICASQDWAVRKGIYINIYTLARGSGGPSRFLFQALIQRHQNQLQAKIIKKVSSF
jgi:hypothetical protein